MTPAFSDTGGKGGPVGRGTWTSRRWTRDRAGRFASARRWTRLEGTDLLAVPWTFVLLIVEAARRAWRSWGRVGDLEALGDAWEAAGASGAILGAFPGHPSASRRSVDANEPAPCPCPACRRTSA